MTVLAQRDGVRVVGFNKCGHTSVINMFAPRSEPVKRPQFGAPNVINTEDLAKQANTYRGDLTNYHDWPHPDVVIAVLRNPVRRALSAYQHFLVRKERSSFTGLGFKFGCTFDEFVEHLVTVDLTGDAHIKPFVPDLIAAGSNSQVLLLPLELLSQIWPVIIEELQIKGTSPTMQFRNKGDYDPDDFLTPELYDTLRTLYQEDYDLWELAYNDVWDSLHEE